MTLTDFYRKVLEKLQVVAAGEAAAPEDVQLIAEKYVSVWNQLKVLGLVASAVNEAVPNEVAEPMILICAFAAADEFDEDPEDYVMGALGMTPPSLAEKQLRQLHARPYVSTPVRTQYF